MSHRDRKLEQALKHELRAAGTPAPDACVDAETLGAWADGGLEAMQMSAVELHVATCARCQAIVGATARSAPAAVAAAPAGFSLWKWWLAPIAAGAAAVIVWMVVPQDSRQQPPGAPAAVTEARRDLPAEPAGQEQAAAPASLPPGADNRLADAAAKRADAPPARLEDRRERRGELLERKQEKPAADQTAIGAVAAAPSVAAPPAAPPVAAEATRQESLRVAAPLEIVSPDRRHRWRVSAGAIERSEDGGASWMQVLAASGDTITAGTSPAGSICWLIGANGAVFVTADGTGFARVPIPERVALTDITATSARSAIVTAADGRRFRTDDAGRTWRPN